MKLTVNPKLGLFFVYFLSNAYSILYTLLSGTFLGFEYSTYDALNIGFFVFAAVFIWQYYFLLFPLFNWLSRIDFLSPKMCRLKGDLSDKKLSLVILALQVAYLSLVLLYDAGKVGAQGAVVPFSSFWAVVQIDYLSITYLMLARKRGVWRVNFLVYAFSSFIRGWTGFVLVAAFVYLIRRDSPLKISVSKAFVSGLLALLLLPIILFFKFYIRTNQSDIAFDSFLDVAFGLDNYFDFLKYSIDYFVNRFQQFTLTWFIWASAQELSEAYRGGLIAPFWSENLYYYFFAGLLGLERLPNLGVYATLFMPYSYEVVLGSFNISPGLIGWVAAAGASTPILILFILFLAAAGFFLIQLIAKRGSREWGDLRNLLWLMWLILLIPGWINQYIAFLHSILIMSLIVYLIEQFDFNRGQV